MPLTEYGRTRCSLITLTHCRYAPLGCKDGRTQCSLITLTRCRYAPLGCKDGYASSDIFFLETCFYSMMCSNHDELFELGVGEDFNCELSRPGFERLRNYILAREHSSWW